MFGWAGSFILGIGFYALSMQSAGAPLRTRAAWCCCALWTLGVALRWTANVYGWHWQTLLPVSAAMELTAWLPVFLGLSPRREAAIVTALAFAANLIVSEHRS